MSNRYRVFMSMNHPGDAYENLAHHVDASCSGSNDPIAAAQLLESITDANGVISVIPDRLSANVLAQLPKLQVVANVAVGYDNIDVAAASGRGILVLNTPGVLDNTTADLGFALLLAAARKVTEADQFVRSGQWSRWTFDLLLGTDLGGKTIGIIGMGRIGQAMARRAVAFGMHVVYSQRNRVAASVENELAGARHLALDELLRESDFISIHCPLSESTHHLLGERQFAMMKPSCILVNTARGAIIDEKALVRALQTGQIRSAGLDVFENEPLQSSELFEMKNVVLTPHIGSASVETRSAMARLAVDGLLLAFSGTLPPNVVNPEVWPEFTKRLATTVR